MDKNYLNYDEKLTAEDLQALEEWKKYVSDVDKWDREAQIRNRILVATILMFLIIILFLIFMGRDIANMIS